MVSSFQMIWGPFCPKPLEIRIKWLPFNLHFQLFGFQMVRTIATAIAMTNHWKSKLQNIWYSRVFGIPMFGIQAPTVLVLSYVRTLAYQLATLKSLNLYQIHKLLKVYTCVPLRKTRR